MYRERKRIIEEAIALEAVTRASGTKNGKLHWVARTINSPAFLWALSAIAISAFGTYFADFQRCTTEAAQVNERFYKLRDELKHRLIPIYAAINIAETITDLKELDTMKRANYPFVYSDFKGQNLADLEYEYNRILKKIEMSELSKEFKMYAERMELTAPTTIEQLGLLPIL